MRLFTRSVLLAGAYTDVVGHATDIRAHVADKIGREVSLWQALFGAPLGAMTFGAHVDGIADLQAIGATLLADAGYHERLAVGRQLSAGPVEDQLLTPVYGELDHPPVGSVIVVTTATMVGGRYIEAAGWGIDIAKHVEKVTGNRTLFMTNDFGPLGQVTWVGIAADAAAADEAGKAINNDAGYIEQLNAGANLFAAGSGHRSMAVRVD